MPSKFDTERLVGLQLRAISGDLTREFRSDVLETIFNSGNSDKLCDVDKSCMEWAFSIGAYFSDTENDEKKQFYMDLIIILQSRGVDLNKSKFWKFLMKREMTIEFFRMFDKFTQVPQLSARNKSKPKSEETDDIEWWNPQ